MSIMSCFGGGGGGGGASFSGINLPPSNFAGGNVADNWIADYSTLVTNAALPCVKCGGYIWRFLSTSTPFTGSLTFARYNATTLAYVDTVTFTGTRTRSLSYTASDLITVNIVSDGESTIYAAVAENGYATSIGNDQMQLLELDCTTMQFTQCAVVLGTSQGSSSQYTPGPAPIFLDSSKGKVYVLGNRHGASLGLNSAGVNYFISYDIATQVTTTNVFNWFTTSTSTGVRMAAWVDYDTVFGDYHAIYYTVYSTATAYANRIFIYNPATNTSTDTGLVFANLLGESTYLTIGSALYSIAGDNAYLIDFKNALQISNKIYPLTNGYGQYMCWNGYSIVCFLTDGVRTSAFVQTVPSDAPIVAKIYKGEKYHGLRSLAIKDGDTTVATISKAQQTAAADIVIKMWMYSSIGEYPLYIERE